MKIDSCLVGFVLCVFCLIISSLAFAEDNNSFVLYVSPSGNNNSNGSLSQSFKTIQHALNVSNSNQDIKIREGLYFEILDIDKSGSDGNYFSISNYENETVVIDGSNEINNKGQKGLINIHNQSWVKIQGLELQNHKTKKRNVPVGIYISGYGKHIQLLDNHIHHIETLYPGCRGNALGIAVYGTNGAKSLGNIEIIGNEVNYLKTGCSESISLNGNVNNFLVENNKIHNNNNIGIDVVSNYKFDFIS